MVGSEDSLAAAGASCWEGGRRLDRPEKSVAAAMGPEAPLLLDGVAADGAAAALDEEVRNAAGGS